MEGISENDNEAAASRCCVKEVSQLHVNGGSDDGGTVAWDWYGLFFFFQAEDGIRDKLVTGVQTCALPILRPERLDVTHVREARETRQRVDAHPLRRLLLPPRIADLLDLGLMRRRGAADELMTPEARLQRRQSGLTGDRCRVVAVHARDLILAGMDVVAKEDRLTRTLERSGVVDDGRLVTLGSRLRLQGGRHCKWRGENQPDHNRS